MRSGARRGARPSRKGTDTAVTVRTLPPVADGSQEILTVKVEDKLEVEDYEAIVWLRD